MPVVLNIVPYELAGIFVQVKLVRFGDRKQIVVEQVMAGMCLIGGYSARNDHQEGESNEDTF